MVNGDRHSFASIRSRDRPFFASDPLLLRHLARHAANTSPVFANYPAIIIQSSRVTTRRHANIRHELMFLDRSFFRRRTLTSDDTDLRTNQNVSDASGGNALSEGCLLFDSMAVIRLMWGPDRHQECLEISILRQLETTSHESLHLFVAALPFCGQYKTSVSDIAISPCNPSLEPNRTSPPQYQTTLRR